MMNTNVAAVEKFLLSPVGQEMAELAERKRLARRKELAAEVDALTADAEKRGLELQAAVERAQAAWRRAQEALREKERALGAARLAQVEAGNRAGYELGIRTRELEETASPRIQEFIDRVQAAIDSVRNTKIIEHPGHLNAVTERRTATVHPDGRSLSAYLAALRSAARAAEALKLEPLTEDEVGEALEAILARIPEAV
jgi:hypothetical protein